MPCSGQKKDRAFVIIATVYASMVLCTRLVFWLLSVKKLFSFQAWQLWKDRRWNEFIDQSFGDEYEQEELVKYLAVALMCVQEKTIDRPTMPDVVAMLSSDGNTLPEPKQPAYSYAKLDVLVNITGSSSRNDVTITTTNGR